MTMLSCLSEIKFTIPGRLPGLNEHDQKNRTSPRKGAEHKRETQEKIGWCILSAGVPRIPAEWYPVRVTFKWYEKDRMRDPDNIAFAKKYILDELQEMRVLQGDGWRHIGALADEFYIDSKKPRVEIIIRSDTHEHSENRT